MEDFQSKYSGEQVEAILDLVANGEAGGGGGGITVETDPVFSASPAASITEEKKTEWDNKMDSVTLAKVATSGSYNDLSNKPTIPAAVTESTVSGWGFTKNTGTYSKPSTGIPKTDLASAVQTSLEKADTALQSYTEQYQGTVTGVKINGTTKNPLNGIVDLGTISADESLQIHFEPDFDMVFGQPIDVTSLIQQYMGTTPAELYEEVFTNGKETTLFMGDYLGGELKEISRVVDSSYEAVQISYLPMMDGQSVPLQLGITPTQCYLVVVDMLAGYNSVVAPLAEAIESKQDELVSGTNIKTINGQSILGSGDITISGDTGGGESSYAGNYPIMFLPETSESVTLSPNTYHVLNRVLSPDATEASLSVNLDVEAANSDIINEYVIELYVEWNGSEDEELPIQLDFSEFIDWANQDIPVLETNHVYLISIANDLGIWTKFS